MTRTRPTTRTLRRPLALVTTLLALVGLAAAQERPEAPDLVTHTLTYEGSDEDRLLLNMQDAALRETVARLLVGERLLVADEILEQYLTRNRGQFVAGVTVREREVDQGDYRLTADVGVFARELERTLTQYRFLYDPRATPLSFIFLDEVLNDARVEQEIARPIVSEILTDAALDVSALAIQAPEAGIDVTEAGTDPQTNPTFALALRSAEDAGVELLFSGQCTMTLSEETDLYYTDDYVTYDATLSLKMIRVDTGEVLADVQVTDSGAHPQEAEAREIAIRNCVNEAVDQLIDVYQEVWRRAVQGQTDYTLLVHDTGDEELDLLVAAIEDLNESAQVYSHARLGRTASLNVDYVSHFAEGQDDTREELVQAMVGLDTPQVRVVRSEGREITVRVVPQ